MRRPYYNQWSFHHGDAALPDVSPDRQLRMAVYSVPATITTAWAASASTDETIQSKEQQKKLLAKSPRLLAVLIGLFVIFLLAFASTLIAWGVLSDGFENHKGRKDESLAEDESFGVDSNGKNKICVSDDCAHVAGDIVRYLDKTVNPCQDFYQFACGRYPQEVAIPRDKDKTGTMDQMEHKVKMQLKELLEGPVNKTESPSNRLVRQFYRLCMDVGSLQRQGLEPLRKAVRGLGGWPANNDDYAWNESGYDWERANAYLRAEYAVEALMIITVEPDWKNNSKKMITIDEPDMGDMNVVRAWRDTVGVRGKSPLHSALDSMVNLALEFGADRDSVIADMEEILLFEILLGNITTSRETRRDRSKFYFPKSLVELRLQVPEINWNELFQALLPANLHIAPDEVIFNVVGLSYLKRLPEVLNRFSKRTLANYHIYYLTDNYVRYLSPGVRELRRSYGASGYLKTPGASSSSMGPARWEECVDETVSLFSWRPLLDAKKDIIVGAKDEVQLMFSYLIRASMKAMQSIDWMDNATSEAAIVKLGHVTLNIPDLIRPVNDTSYGSSTEYEELNITNISYFDAVVQLNSIRNRLTFISLRERSKAVDQIDGIDSITPTAVNAFYRFDRNEVVLPSFLLQPPLFSRQMPGYVQYSRLGAFTAHEIMHGYDEEGRQYDEYGNLKRWWSNATVRSFDARLECLIEQYSNITEPVSGHHLNGKRTLGENFADHGGIKIAYDSYLTWKQEQKSDEEGKLPGLSAFTNKQTFFLSFANVWCESIRPEAAALFVDEDEHALGRYRVNVPLQNLPVFSEVFSCPLGSPMNPVNKCQLW